MFRHYKKIDVKLIGGAIRKAQKFKNNTVRVPFQINGRLKLISGEEIDGNFYSFDPKYDEFLMKYRRQRNPIKANTKEEYAKIIQSRLQEKRDQKYRDFNLTIETEFGPRMVHDYRYIKIKSKKIPVVPDYENKCFVRLDKQS